MYAGRVKNRQILMNSSSGGAFTALSDLFLANDDAVICAVYNYQTHTADYQIIHTIDERDAARGSRYMQSRPRDIYRVAMQWLVDHPDKRILFVGMGCQADGFRIFAEMKGFRERVGIVDIICHGSPSPRLWREYAELLENQYGKITYLTFKDKRNGWRAPTAIANVGDQEVSLKEYVRVFYNRCALRPSCYECLYATTERKTDMTIGDFWHIEETIPEFYDKDGTSLFLIHTDRGEELFEGIKERLDYRISDTQQCWQANLEAPTPRSEHRDAFWKDYNRRGIKYIIKKYGNIPLSTKVKKRIVKIISIRGAELTPNTNDNYIMTTSVRRVA